MFDIIIAVDLRSVLVGAFHTWVPVCFFPSRSDHTLFWHAYHSQLEEQLRDLTHQNATLSAKNLVCDRLLVRNIFAPAFAPPSSLLSL